MKMARNNRFDVNHEFKMPRNPKLFEKNCEIKMPPKFLAVK